MNIIDFHTHAFPDALAERAMTVLAKMANVQPVLDGTVAALVRSMDTAGIERSVVASIATRPKQFASILDWSKQIASDRIVPFLSVHPADPEAVARVRQVRDEGFKGIKLHPYYQEFDADEEWVFPVYQAIADCGLALLLHTGYDIGYPRFKRCDPARIRTVFDTFPDLKLVTSHFGAWDDWDAVEEHLLGKPIYMDPSHSIEFMGVERARSFLMAHPQDYLVFGTDSPWDDQGESVDVLRAMALGSEREAALLGGNAKRLLETC